MEEKILENAERLFSLMGSRGMSPSSLVAFMGERGDLASAAKQWFSLNETGIPTGWGESRPRPLSPEVQRDVQTALTALTHLLRMRDAGGNYFQRQGLHDVIQQMIATLSGSIQTESFSEFFERRRLESGISELLENVSAYGIDVDQFVESYLEEGRYIHDPILFENWLNQVFSQAGRAWKGFKSGVGKAVQAGVKAWDRAGKSYGRLQQQNSNRQAVSNALHVLPLLQKHGNVFGARFMNDLERVLAALQRYSSEMPAQQDDVAMKAQSVGAEDNADAENEPAPTPPGQKRYLEGPDQAAAYILARLRSIDLQGFDRETAQKAISSYLRARLSHPVAGPAWQERLYYSFEGNGRDASVVSRMVSNALKRMQAAAATSVT